MYILPTKVALFLVMYKYIADSLIITKKMSVPDSKGGHARYYWLTLRSL